MGLRRKQDVIRVRELVSAVAKDQLDVILALPQQMGSDWSDTLAEALNPLVTEADKQKILHNLPSHPWLSALVQKRGWGRDALPFLTEVLASPRELDGNLYDLLLTVDDDLVRKRLLADFKQNPQRQYESLEALSKMPSIRQDLRRVADELWSSFQPTLQQESRCRLELAMMFGNHEALDWSLRLAGLAAEERGGHLQYEMMSNLPGLLSLPQPPRNAGNGQLAPPYRHLKAEDFVYLPDQLRWQRKP